MNKLHIISTTDPVNGFDDVGDLTVYFETETSRQIYLDTPAARRERELSKTSGNPTDNRYN